MSEHAPLLSLDRGILCGCTCGWRPRRENGDVEFQLASHVAVATATPPTTVVEGAELLSQAADSGDRRELEVAALDYAAVLLDYTAERILDGGAIWRRAGTSVDLLRDLANSRRRP